MHHTIHLLGCIVTQASQPLRAQFISGFKSNVCLQIVSAKMIQRTGDMSRNRVYWLGFATIAFRRARINEDLFGTVQMIAHLLCGQHAHQRRTALKITLSGNRWLVAGERKARALPRANTAVQYRHR